MNSQGKKLRRFILVSLLNMGKLFKESICSSISIALYPEGSKQSNELSPFRKWLENTDVQVPTLKEIFCCKESKFFIFSPIRTMGSNIAVRNQPP